MYGITLKFAEIDVSTPDRVNDVEDRFFFLLFHTCEIIKIS